MIESVIFLAGSVGIFALSWRSLRVPHAHGRPRLLGFECVLALLLHQARGWFVHRLAPHQLVSWLLLAVSAWLALEGVRLLYRLGRPESARGRPSDLGFVQTSVLVNEGAYRWIRHPLYASLLSGARGAFFKGPSWTAAALGAAANLAIHPVRVLTPGVGPSTNGYSHSMIWKQRRKSLVTQLAT